MNPQKCCNSVQCTDCEKYIECTECGFVTNNQIKKVIIEQIFEIRSEIEDNQRT